VKTQDGYDWSNGCRHEQWDNVTEEGEATARRFRENVARMYQRGSISSRPFSPPAAAAPACVWCADTGVMRWSTAEGGKPEGLQPPPCAKCAPVAHHPV
jgi:hypothetical protein